jgi:hypothetical protein
MDLDMLLKINEPKSTNTHESYPPRPEGTDGNENGVRHSQPERLRLDVDMTFSGGTPTLTAREIGVTVEGESIGVAFRHLVEETRERLASSEDARRTLLDYPPETWFRFVAPDQTAYMDKAALTSEFISALKKLYEFKGSRVESFLKENPSLTSLLFAAYGAVHEHFGSGVETALEVVVDPEALGDRQLFVLIRTELPRKEARVHLAELDRGWWLGALPAAEGKMEIALD